MWFNYLKIAVSAAKSNSRKRRFGLADKGYQGIQKLHANSQLPKKKRKGKQLSQLDREMNQKLERVRGICYRIIGRLKVFKILAERYRNRRKRFGLRFNLIAGLYNYELGLSKSS